MKLSDLISCVRGDIRITKPVTAGSGETLSPAARRMRDNHVGTPIIVEGQKPVGIVTDRDLALALGANGVSPETAVESVMTTPVRTIADGAGIFTATQCMRNAGGTKISVKCGISPSARADHQRSSQTIQTFARDNARFCARFETVVLD